MFSFGTLLACSNYPTPPIRTTSSFFQAYDEKSSNDDWNDNSDDDNDIGDKNDPKT